MSNNQQPLHTEEKFKNKDQIMTALLSEPTINVKSDISWVDFKNDSVTNPAYSEHDKVYNKDIIETAEIFARYMQSHISNGLELNQENIHIMQCESFKVSPNISGRMIGKVDQILLHFWAHSEGTYAEWVNQKPTAFQTV